MSISNYGELKTQLNTYLFQQRFISQYDNATIKFERVVRRKLRVQPMEAVATLTTIGGAVALPSDYIKWRAVVYKGLTPFTTLDYVHPAYLESSASVVVFTRPKVFTIEACTFKARPIDDVAGRYELHYYQKPTPLVGADGNMNWLLTEFPDLYEYGVLRELFKLARNREAAELYKAHRDEVFKEVKDHYAEA